jgi:hypothetical protein
MNTLVQKVWELYQHTAGFPVETILTRKSGLFKRPTSWPAYETLDRHNLFRFYDWGFVNVQENVKLDADGKLVARETGVITGVKAKAPAGGATP